MEQLKNRLIRYCKIDTRSDDSSSSIPSTLSQVEFAKMLVNELLDIGLSEVKYHAENGFVTATLKANTEKKVDTLGFIAHFDTADYPSTNINPQVITQYDGNDIILNEDSQIVMKIADFPNLKNYVNHTLVTTDGSTLLGADDKAGIAAIIEALIYLIENPNIIHGEVRVAFGPDEEIGRGADLFDAKGFRAKYAYTVDGSVIGELEYESFNAASAKVYLEGVSVHPGTAKDKMINASKLAFEFDSLLPSEEVPEKTEGYQGFFLCSSIETSIEKGVMNYIIRDHDRAKFEQRKQLMFTIAHQINERIGKPCVSIVCKDQYYNMGEIIAQDMRPVELAKEAMLNLDITPIIKPIRGGTDGSKISFMGIPTPNIFTGAENFHGKYEFISLENLHQSKMTIVEIIRLNAL